MAKIILVHGSGHRAASWEKTVSCLGGREDILCPELSAILGGKEASYGRLFGWYGWGTLVLPTLVTLAPPLVFALGSGWRLGELRPWLLYVWMALPFVLSALPLPQALGLWDGSFFASYPLTLDALDPAFSMPASAWLAQGLTLALGLLLLALPSRKKGV